MANKITGLFFVLSLVFILATSIHFVLSEGFPALEIYDRLSILSIGVLFVFLFGLLITYLLPQELCIERSARVAASVDAAFNAAGDLRRSNEWFVYGESEVGAPRAIYYSTPPWGLGAKTFVKVGDVSWATSVITDWQRGDSFSAEFLGVPNGWKSSLTIRIEETSGEAESRFHIRHVYNCGGDRFDRWALLFYRLQSWRGVCRAIDTSVAQFKNYAEKIYGSGDYVADFEDRLEGLLKPHIHNQPVYVPGRPLEIVARERGLDPAGVLKLASNENLFGASPKGVAAAQAACAETWLYPDSDGYFLREKLAATWGLQPGQFILGAGSNQVIEMLGHCFVGPGTEVVFGEVSFISYKIVTLLFGGTPVPVPMTDGLVHDLDAMRAAVTDKTRLVFLPSPNNPTGTINTNEEILAFAESLPEHVIFCFDEAYAEYLDDPPDLRPLIAAGRKIICLRTFSKMYGLAGFRVGYGYSSEEMIGFLNRVRGPFNVTNVGLAAAIAALEDDEFVASCREQNRAALEQMTAGLRDLEIEVVPSHANFVLAKVPDAGAVSDRLLDRGVIVRPLAGFGLPDYLRIGVGQPEQNEKALAAVRDCLG